MNGGGGLAAKLCQIRVNPWTVALQAPLSMGFSRQEYWSGWPFPSPGDLPNPGIEPRSTRIAGGFCTNCAMREVQNTNGGTRGQSLPRGKVLQRTP